MKNTGGGYLIGTVKGHPQPPKYLLSKGASVSLTPAKPIPADELARRICAAHHPHLGTVAAQVPCGAHLQAARNVYGLVTEDGTMTFDVVAQARNEAGMPTLVSMLGDVADTERALILEGIEAFRLTREYVGLDCLPAVEGWSWYDWTDKAEKALGIVQVQIDERTDIEGAPA